MMAQQLFESIDHDSALDIVNSDFFFKEPENPFNGCSTLSMRKSISCILYGISGQITGLDESAMGKILHLTHDSISFLIGIGGPRFWTLSITMAQMIQMINTCSSDYAKRLKRVSGIIRYIQSMLSKASIIYHDTGMTDNNSYNWVYDMLYQHVCIGYHARYGWSGGVESRLDDMEYDIKNGDMTIPYAIWRTSLDAMRSRTG